MVRASKGYKRGTRRRLKRRNREKFTVERMVKEFKPSDKVIINISASSQKSFPHPNYLGFAGIVKGMRGRSYIVAVKKGNKEKELIIRPEHLERIVRSG